MQVEIQINKQSSALLLL